MGMMTTKHINPTMTMMLTTTISMIAPRTDSEVQALLNLTTSLHNIVNKDAPDKITAPMASQSNRERLASIPPAPQVVLPTPNNHCDKTSTKLPEPETAPPLRVESPIVETVPAPPLRVESPMVDNKPVPPLSVSFNIEPTAPTTFDNSIGPTARKLRRSRLKASKTHPVAAANSATTATKATTFENNTHFATHGSAINPDSGYIAEYKELLQCSGGHAWAESMAHGHGRGGRAD